MKIVNASGNPKDRQQKTVSRWLAYLLFVFVWVVIPWLLSLLTPRYGWVQGHPGVWNLLGLIPVMVGLAGSLATLDLHFAKSNQRLNWELDKNYLLRDGTYSFSRNPMYLFELILLFGWVLSYGSIAVLAAFHFYIVPQEERVIEAHFGDTYREYKRKVSRWFGLSRR